MAYRYEIKNTYRPSQLAPKAYGWSGQPQLRLGRRAHVVGREHAEH